jgi:hypothetical protein
MVAIASQSITAAWQRKVVNAEGALDIQVFGRGGQFIVIGRAHVRAPTGSSDALKKGEIYRLNYVQGSNQFLSIEPLSKVP